MVYAEGAWGMQSVCGGALFLKYCNKEFVSKTRNFEEKTVIYHPPQSKE